MPLQISKNNQTRPSGRHRRRSRLRLIAPTTSRAIMADASEECTEQNVKELSENIIGQLWRVEAMLLLNTIFAGVIVGIGAYGHRYRHYGFTRYLMLGVTTLFLPVISYVISASGSVDHPFHVLIHEELIANCWAPGLHTSMVITSTCLVLICAINTSPVVATDDREDRSVRPPFELLVQGIWILYLAIPSIGGGRSFEFARAYFIITPFALIYAKMALKCYAFLKARKSFALGRNPRLIVGYMQQLLREEGDDQHGEEDVNVPPPPLVVTGEDKRQVEKQPEPHGYMFRNNMKALQDGNLVTIERVWQLDTMFLMPMPQRLKDICLSFALFKLLRCRFARYKLANVITKETIKFVRRVMLKDGEHERAFRMIADELSFLHDYYDSPLPVLYPGSWFTTTLSMVISLLSICYCILYVLDVIKEARIFPQERAIISCMYFCSMSKLGRRNQRAIRFGRLHFDLVPGLLLTVFVVVAEARDIASHICSSWTKVILTCRCVRRASLKLPPVVPKWVGWLLRCRCDWLLRHWNDKMRQSSLLVFQRMQFHQLVLPGCLLRLLDRKSNNVKVPSEVKACIINALRSTSGSNGAGLSKGMTTLRQSQIGRSLLWACNNSKGTSDTILVWHIATAILEVRHPHHQGDGRPSSVSDMKSAATHLSRYCAYLVEFCPELLPDDDAWSKHLYKKVKKDAKRALATGGGTPVSSMTPEAAYQKLVELLGATQNHEVLKDAAKLAKQLRELAGGEEMEWELLAGFWSELILYLAPSDNLKGHLQAVDRGGELITLLWALITHIGIIDRPGDTAASAPAIGV
ncbi:hypothetical protein CFC21_089659 [Triticum aestivum]|uniref:DUF4220 domain-containing protein n=2 Tax=Triticum aestivum TaxID=4565 RepID=A0A9R1LD36_WHEAT|nr:uncharacterized protein LOC123134762 [Triticum aestivum]KAF7086365.1 hypothetical protein CFC21_089659 [Triticum aestivum]